MYENLPRPLTNTDDEGHKGQSLQLTGVSEAQPFYPEQGSSAADVANHAYRIAIARKEPVFFVFNTVPFKVEIINNEPIYTPNTTQLTSQEAIRMAPRYQELFNSWWRHKIAQE